MLKLQCRCFFFGFQSTRRLNEILKRIYTLGFFCGWICFCFNWCFRLKELHQFVDRQKSCFFFFYVVFFLSLVKAGVAFFSQVGMKLLICPQSGLEPQRQSVWLHMLRSKRFRREMICRQPTQPTSLFEVGAFFCRPVSSNVQRDHKSGGKINKTSSFYGLQLLRRR